MEKKKENSFGVSRDQHYPIADSHASELVEHLQKSNR